MGEANGAIRESSKSSVKSFMRVDRHKKSVQSSCFSLNHRHLQLEDDDVDGDARENATPQSEMAPDNPYPVLSRQDEDHDDPGHGHISTSKSEGVLGSVGAHVEDGDRRLNENSQRFPDIRLTSIKQLITKGNNSHFFNGTNNAWSSSFLPTTLISEQISSISKCNLGWFRIVSLLFLFLFIANDLPKSNAVLFDQSKCETYGWNAFPVWKYRAKPRWVAPLKMDRRMQEEFFKLFRGGDQYEKDSSEEDSYDHEDVHLDIMELQRISDMCPKDAFFYSLSPKHLEASAALAKMFTDLPSPPDVLRLAKALLRSRLINPKVWYFGLIGAAQERPDMTGFKLAHPVDAMPDIFIPGYLLYEVIDKYRSALQERKGLLEAGTNTTNTKTRRGRRGKRATIIYSSPVHSSPSSSSPSSPQGSKPPRNTIKRLVRKYAKKNETVAPLTSRRKIERGLGQMIKGEGVTKNATIVNVSPPTMPTSGNRTDRSRKYESGLSSSSSSRAFKGAYKIRRKNKEGSSPIKKTSKKPKKKPEVYRGNVTEFLEESGSSWQRARDSHAFDDCILVDGTVGLKNGIENRLWYFREDMMVNQHHWYWHQEYPLNTTMHRPRRAELFFYMHHNLVARYNAELLSNGMPSLEPFDIRPGAEIRTAYDSHLADINSGKLWTPRPHGVRFEDVIHYEDPDFERNIYVGHYNDLYGRLIRSIQVGHLLLNPIKTLKIRNTKGIEPLGNTVEASELSVNPVFYDAMGFHNLGHQLIGLATDPKYKLRLPTGVMADTSTTMRDPEFYSYHTVVDDIFDKYKKSLKPYKPRGGEYPLRWDGVEILDVEVISKNGGGHRNQLRTFWSTKRFELAPGVDQSIHKGDLDVDVCAVHLNHEPFDFKITVTLDPCAKTKTNKGSVRIFLAPRYDKHGHLLSLTKQRRLMIHMDTFPVDLRVGKNVIFRRSFDSNAVTPWSKHLNEYEHAPKHPHSADFCGCGWPTHLYIPKGTPDGMLFDVFVMITNYDHDYVEEDPDNESIPEPCNSPYMYCGVKWRNYPDAKPMGYPFDRLPFTVPISCPKGVASIWTLVICKILSLFLLRPVATLDEYVSYAPNMASTIVEIKHLDHLVW